MHALATPPCRRLHEEVKVVGDSGRLSALVASGIGKALLLLAEKAQYMAATGPEVRSASGAVTSAQLRNISLASQLQEVHKSMAGLLQRMPPASQQALVCAPLLACPYLVSFSWGVMSGSSPVCCVHMLLLAWRIAAATRDVGPCFC